MRQFLPFLIMILVLPGLTEAAVIFQSKWDSPNLISWNAEDDGGAWHYAYADSGNISLQRVNGSQTNLGGPSGPPTGSSATYFLREIWTPNGQDCQVYLQANFAPQYQNLIDYYGGMWVYFQNGFQFIDSMKFFDFRTENQAVGNGHVALFGFDHDAMGCSAASHTSWNVAGGLCGYPSGHNLVVFRYLAGPGQNVAGNEYMFNYYDSPMFETNIDSSGSVVSDSGYTVNSPSRVCATGGQWMAFIFHARIHDTDGRYEAWIKKGTDQLTKVMDWNRSTVWPQSSGPHNFYTMNGGGVDHLQINGYWNGWPSASGIRRIWFSNVIVATTYNEVADYLGLSAGQQTCSQLGGVACCTGAQTCSGIPYAGASDCSGTCCSVTCTTPPACTDLDGDGYGNPASSSCTYPTLDCNDSNLNIHPGAIETCSNGVDEDCSGADLACPACSQGQVTSRCLCGGSPYQTGYCCSGVWQSNQCPVPQGTVTETWGNTPDSNHTGTLQDTFINVNTDTNSNSDSLLVYTWPANQVANAILMKWDLSALPQNASIQNAKLYLYLTGTDGTGGDNLYDVSVNRIINHNPTISSATGYTYDGTNSWTSNSCCYNNIPMAQADIATAEDTKSINKTLGYNEWIVAQTVSYWVYHSSENYGMLVNADQSAALDSNRIFTSNENTNANWRPKLVITYSIFHKADTDQSGCVSMNELQAFIARWQLDSSDPTIRELIEAIGLWKRGC